MSFISFIFAFFLFLISIDDMKTLTFKRSYADILQGIALASIYFFKTSIFNIIIYLFVILPFLAMFFGKIFKFGDVYLLTTTNLFLSHDLMNMLLFSLFVCLFLVSINAICIIFKSKEKIPFTFFILISFLMVMRYSNI